MKVRLDRLGDEPYVWQESLAFPSRELDVLALSEVDCRGRLHRTTPGFLLEIRLSYQQTLACTRCLGEIVDPIESRIDLLVQVQEDAPGEATDEVELEESDLGVLTLSGPHLDTRPLVAEQVQLGVPMKPLCREDCAGICPECGADLNAGKCDCRPAADPRWSGLAQWSKLHGEG